MGLLIPPKLDCGFCAFPNKPPLWAGCCDPNKPPEPVFPKVPVVLALAPPIWPKTLWFCCAGCWGCCGCWGCWGCPNKLPGWLGCWFAFEFPNNPPEVWPAVKNKLFKKKNDFSWIRKRQARRLNLNLIDQEIF